MNASTEVKREEILAEFGWQFDALLRHLPFHDAEALRRTVELYGERVPIFGPVASEDPAAF